jgi:1-deoxyxylulose-5-phosphate synthase
MSEKDSINLLVEAHELGIRGINTADSDYSGRSELYVGKFLAAVPSVDRPFLVVELSGEDMGVPHSPNLTPAYLRLACERSLKRLGVEAIDRVVLPRPSFTIPIEETLSGVQELIIDAGLALSYGVSTFPSWLTCHGQHVCSERGYARIASELAPYNVLDRRVENEILPNVQFWEMEFYAWGALGQGLLADRYSAGGEFPHDSRAAVLGGIYADRVGGAALATARRFVELCREFGYEPATAALTWLLGRPGVTGCVAGPRSVAHLRPMSASLGLTLPDDFRLRVDAINGSGGAVADFFNSAPWMRQTVSTSSKE